MSPNKCAGGTKINIVPGSAWLDVDIRTLPGQTRDYVVTHLKKALGPLANEVEISEVPAEAGALQSVGSVSSCDSPLVKLMGSVLKEVCGENAKLIPMLMVGGTDCRFFRTEFGTDSYGYAVYDGALDLNTLAKLAHGDNERVSLGTLDLTSKAYKEIATRLLS
jgi:acetylornithine deacetylase/succinyl-diaminopimelate desuccinylase-like protein